MAKKEPKEKGWFRKKMRFIYGALMWKKEKAEKKNKIKEIDRE